MNLYDYFKLDLPLKDIWTWNGKPLGWSNMQKWNIGRSQGFAQNLLDYSQFGLKGHNGLDLAFRRGCPITAPYKLYVTYTDESDVGYGLNLFAETESKQIDGVGYYLEFCFAHFKTITAKSYVWYDKGELLGFGDSTGFSTGDHLHFGIRPYKNLSTTTSAQIYPNNGYKGYVDPEPFLPRVDWNYRDLINELLINRNMLDKLRNFFSKNDTNLVFNKKTGEMGWIYNGYLRVAKGDRVPQMIAMFLIRKFKLPSVSEDDWKNMPKIDF